MSASQSRSASFKGGERRMRDWARYRTVSRDVGLLEAAFEHHVYDRHLHESYAIGVTLRGVQRFWCRGTTHDCVRGDVIVIPPGEVHDGRSGSDGGYAYRMFYVAEVALADIVSDALERDVQVVHSGREIRIHAPTLAQRVDTAWRAMHRDPRSLAAEELYRLAFAPLVVRRPHQVPPNGPADHPTLARVRDYLRDNLGRPVTMRELSEIASMSRFRLTRQFAKVYGLPLHAYHVQLRLEEAKRRIRCGDPLATIAVTLGFVDQSHLHRRFRGAFGVTPGEWRRGAT
jgi:AraC-like DNA-binding protein